jgi:uncharacterized repeat protein (TIGR01451 family)
MIGSKYGLPQLTLSKSGPAIVPAGSEIEYSLTVRNTSDITATEVQIFDKVPTGSTYISGGSMVEDKVVWNGGTLPPSEFRVYTFTVTATQSISNITYWVNYNGGYTRFGTNVVTTTIAEGSDFVTPEDGGQVTSSDGAATVDFPPGAVNGPVFVEITPLTSLIASTYGYTYAGLAFEINALDTDGQPVTQFNQPFTLTTTYTETAWQDAGIANEEDLNLYYWNGSAWKAILPCTGCTHDTATNIITVLLDHLTEFALLVPAEGEGGGQKVYLPVIIK